MLIVQYRLTWLMTLGPVTSPPSALQSLPNTSPMLIIGTDPLISALGCRSASATASKLFKQISMLNPAVPSKNETNEASRESEEVASRVDTEKSTETCPRKQTTPQGTSKSPQQAPTKTKKRKNHRGGTLSKEKRINRLFDHANRQTCPDCIGLSLAWSCTACNRTLPGGNWASINLAAEDSPTSLFGRVRFLTSVGLRSGKTATMAETIYSGVQTLVKMHSALRGMQQSGDAEQREFVATFERQTWIPFVAGWTWAEHDLAGEDREDSVMGMIKTLYEAGALSREEARGWWDEGRDVIEAWKLIKAELEARIVIKVPGTTNNERSIDDDASSEAETIIEEEAGKQESTLGSDEQTYLPEKDKGKAQKHAARRRKQRGSHQHVKHSLHDIKSSDKLIFMRKPTGNQSPPLSETMMPIKTATNNETVIQEVSLASEPKSTEHSPITLNPNAMAAIEELISAVETSQKVSSPLTSLDTNTEKPLSDELSITNTGIHDCGPLAGQRPLIVDDSDEEVIVFKPRGRR